MTPTTAASSALPWLRASAAPASSTGRLELRRRLVRALEESGLRERGRCTWVETGPQVRSEGLGALATWLGGGPASTTELPGLLLLLPGGRAGWLQAGRCGRAEAGRALRDQLEWLGVPTAAAYSEHDLEPLLVEWGVLLPGEGLAPR